MTDLSPAAQAVLDSMYEVNMDFNDENHAIAAAALRAAADAIEPIDITPDHEWLLEQLLAIAAELEGGND
jgi:hypothetical protein